MIALVYIYQLTKFGNLMSCGSKDIHSKMHPVTCTNTRHDVTDFVNHGMVKYSKTWISWKRNITFLWSKKIINLCIRWHIVRGYHFAAEVTFKETKTAYVGSKHSLNPVVPLRNKGKKWHKFFYFHISFWCLEKSFWGTTKKC